MKDQAQSWTRLFSPHKKICEVPLRQVQRQLVTLFKHWGVPQWIKVDNGLPFGNPQRETTPVLALWLIGLGITVIWNRSRTPTDNAKVERCQGVLGNWIEFEKCTDTHALQKQVWKQAKFYNYHFPVRRLNQQKRIEVFPTLPFTGRPWNPVGFQLQRVLNFLAEGSWQRKVSAKGQVYMYGQRFSVGIKYKHQYASIRLCQKQNQWKVFDQVGNLIKVVPTPFSKKSIWNLELS